VPRGLLTPRESESERARAREREREREREMTRAHMQTYRYISHTDAHQARVHLDILPNYTHKRETHTCMCERERAAANTIQILQKKSIRK